MSAPADYLTSQVCDGAPPSGSPPQAWAQWRRRVQAIFDAFDVPWNAKTVMRDVADENGYCSRCATGVRHPNDPRRERCEDCGEG